MTLDEANKIIGNQPDWVLPNMIKALSIHSLLNTPEESKRLEAAKVVMKARAKEKRYGTQGGS